MSTRGPITVVARWWVATDAVDAVLALTGELRIATLAEPGCLGYDVFRSVGDPGQLLLVERYSDAAAIEAHRAAPHYKSFVGERILPFLKERKVELLQAADSM